MKAFLLRILSVLLMFPLLSHASPNPSPLAPQPTACITAKFRVKGTNWKTIALRLTNNCDKPVDFQNTTVTFLNKVNLQTPFCGNFSPLSYPDNQLMIMSQPQADGKFLASFHLHFPENPNSNTLLPVGRSISIRYSAKSDDHIDGSVNVYLGTPPVSETGKIEFTNTTAKPTNVNQTFALIHLTSNGQKVTDVQLPWQMTLVVPNLAVGSYAISADAVKDTNGNTYQGTANPASLTLAANQTAKVAVSYALVQQIGKVAIKLQALPGELAGYTGKPTALVTQAGTGSSVSVPLNWGTTSTVSQLKSGSTYNFSTPNINFNGFECKPTFTPPTLVAADPAPTTNLTYACSQVAQSKITLNVTGAPTNLASLKVTFTPNNNGAPISQTVTLNNGSGTNSVMLMTNVVYTVSADAVSGYAISFNPQPLTATANATETVTLKQNTTGTPVAINGQLKVCGTHLCNEHGTPIQLKGMSSHGLQWYGLNVCLTSASLDALAKDFNAGVMRISMYVQEGGYETDPVGFTNQVSQLIEEAYKRGIYAIVDWHQLDPGDPNVNFTKAQKFFTDIATAHKDKNNLIYEIANEPNGVSWASIKSYADKLIPIIRAIDPKTVIVVGTAGWSSLGISDGRNSQDIINNPVNFPNIMYTFHFYAASHKDEYYNELDKASNVLPIFVTEFGTQTFTGDGANDFVMSEKYIQLMAAKKISWTNWNYSDDFRSGAIWKVGTCSAGPWIDANLKPAGVWIKERIKS